MYLDKQLAIDLALVLTTEEQELHNKCTDKSALHKYVFYRKIRYHRSNSPKEGSVSVFLNAEESKLILSFNTDAEEDIQLFSEFNLISFEAYDKSATVPRNVMVNQHIYADYCTLRKELFQLIRWFSLRELIITGHGTSGAQGSLFIFDLGLSRPYLPVTSLMFGIPRTGNFGFTYAFNRSVQQLRAPLIRISNQKDWLTYLPLDKDGYRHIGKSLELCFYRKGVQKGQEEFLQSSHAMNNYNKAIQKYFEASNSVDGNEEFGDLQFCNHVPIGVDEQIQGQIRSMQWYSA